MKRNWIPAFAGMTLLLVPALAGAQVYKCKDAQGHMKYSQSPCHDAPQAPATVAAPVAEPATPERTEKVSPEQRAQKAPAPKADPDADKPRVDSMGRPDVTRMSAPK